MAKRNEKLNENEELEAQAEAGEDAGQAEVANTFDEAEDKGYLGVGVDPTPNENYTLMGQLKGLPTPESDPEMKKQADDRLATLRGEENEDK